MNTFIKTDQTAQEMIQEIRKSTGLSRTEFSRRYGIPLRTMEEWEAGRRVPPEYIPEMLYYYVCYKKVPENKKAGKKAGKKESRVKTKKEDRS